jgi:cytochrome c oxidase assembly factor CtaG
LFFLLPPPVLRPLATFRPLRAVLSVLLIPLVSLGLWGLAFLAWHLPVAYDYAAAHPLVHDLQHLSFVVAGVLAWTQLVDPARHGRLRRPQRVLFALGMLVLAQPIVAMLLFSTSPRYPRYTGAHGISALTDQRLAGVVMMVEQLLTLGLCVFFLLRPYLKERRERPRQPALSHSSR